MVKGRENLVDSVYQEIEKFRRICCSQKGREKKREEELRAGESIRIGE